MENKDVWTRTLASMRGLVLANLIPHLTENSAITSAHVLVRFVDYLIADMTDGNALPPPRELIDAFAELRPGEDIAALADDARMEEIIGGLVTRPDADRFLTSYADWQTARIVARDPEAAGGIGEMFRGGKTSRADDTEPERKAELTPRLLQEYMRARWPERQGLEIESLAHLPGGFSKQTILVTARENGVTDRFVLRKDFEISPAERVVKDEFPLLSAIASVGAIPAPTPRWLEADAAPLGTPAMAVDLAAGSGDFSAIMTDPKKGRQFADHLAIALARLHTLDVSRMPGVEPCGSAREGVAREIDRWYADWRRWRTDAHPLLEGAFAWLRENIPPVSTPPAIVHGDVGTHNMLVDDDRLSALLDWEFAHFGDPAEDIVYCRFFVEQFVEWESFLRTYERHGGTRPSPEAERFYKAWASARNSAGCAGARYFFLKEPQADARLGVSGLTFLPRFELDAFSCAVKSAA